MKPLFIVGIIVLASAFPADALLLSLTPSADAFLSGANPALNYGGAGALGVSASGLPKGEFDSLLQFDFAAAKSSFDAFYGAGGWTIQSITLTLAATPPGNALFNGNLAGPGGSNINTAGLFALKWLQNDAWTEGAGIPQTPSATGVNFNSLPGLVSGADEALGTFAFNGATSGSAGYNLALTASFVADASAGNLVSFLALPADASVAMLVNSRSVGNTALRPSLAIVAVPEPCGATLALVGLLVFASRRRRA